VLSLVVIGGVKVQADGVSYINTNTTYTNTTQKTEATLNGVVNPGGNTTTAWFEYSSNSNFTGLQETDHIFLGSQNKEISISATIYNLSPNVTYYARVVADNGINRIKGNTVTFSTNSGYNTVISNPIYKNNLNYKTVLVQEPRLVEKTVLFAEPIYVMGGPQIYSGGAYAYQPYANVIPNYNTATVNPYVSPENYTYPENTYDYNNTLAATTVYSNSFLPNNIFTWLILVLILIAIAIIIRKLVF